MKVDESLLRKTLSILSSLGYQTFISIGRRTTFDILAKEGKKLILVKVLSNVDGLKREQANSLKCLASRLGASAIVVGLKTKSGELKDDLVYERYGLYVVTPETLEKALTGNMPSKKFWKGRIVTRIDPNDLDKIIDDEGIQKVADILGVSREAIYQYKRGMGVDIDRAESLSKMYGVRLGKFDILKPPTPEEVKVSGYLEDLERLGFEIIPAYSGFDAIAKDKEKLVVAKKSVITPKTTEYLKGAGGFLNGHPLLVANVRETNIDNVPVIKESEIKSAKKPGDIIKLVKERENQ